ncbi:MAG: hypothetical protein PHV59_03435 [Victivallales bacterium]|nr:hypothetical protein [Victivallales bacterium]
MTANTNPSLTQSDNQQKSLSFGRRLLRNTASNYLSTVIKIVSAIFLTYMLYKRLGKEFYGFLSLLWGVSIYSLLLDLGFGKAVEKYTAEASFSGNMEKFNSIIATIIVGYFLMSLVIMLIGFGISFYLEHIFHLHVGDYTLNISYYRRVFMLFIFGIAAVFPSGVFPTILLGLQRTYLRNYVIIGNKLIELAGVWLIFYTDNSLMTLIIFTSALNLASNMVMAGLAFHYMPGLKISFRYIKLHALKYIADFSLFTYLLTICDLIIFRTDPLLLGVMVGMGGVAIYQIATKIPQLISIASTQFQANLAPIAAILHKSGETQKIRRALLYSTRITVFICTGVFAVFIPLVRPILYAWLKVDDALTISMAYILIMSMYMLIIFRDTAKHFLLMTGYHRLLTGIAFAESISNLVLSIIFIKLLGVVGVAWGTLIPNIIISIMIIFPLAAKHSGYSAFAYLLKVYLPVFLFTIPIITTVIYFTRSIPLKEWSFISLFITAAATGTLYLLSGWMFYVSREEKLKLCSFLPAFIPPKLIRLIIW